MIFLNRAIYHPDPKKADAVRPAHVAYLSELANAGKVLLSGPSDGCGITAYDVSSREELDRIIERDPFVQEGVVTKNEAFLWDVKIGADRLAR